MSRVILDLPHEPSAAGRELGLPTLHTLVREHDTRRPIEIIQPGSTFGRRYTEQEALTLAGALLHVVEQRRLVRAERVR